MIRVAGKNLKDDKQIRFALTNVKGIGKNNVKQVLADLNIDQKTTLKDLSEELLTKLRNKIDSLVIESDLRRFNQANIKHLIDIKSWHGTRHIKNLPVRGQTTKTNSRTVRGNKKNSGSSGKIKATKK